MWAKADSGSKSTLWLYGPAGAGKSAIVQTVAKACARRDELAASFFFARTVACRNSAKYLFLTIHRLVCSRKAREIRQHPET